MGDGFEVRLQAVDDRGEHCWELLLALGGRVAALEAAAGRRPVEAVDVEGGAGAIVELLQSRDDWRDRAHAALEAAGRAAQELERARVRVGLLEELLFAMRDKVVELEAAPAAADLAADPGDECDCGFCVKAA